MTAAALHPAFNLLRKVPIPALNLEVEEYCHRATGAIHYHLAADNPENVFLVALRTVPMDHKGIAHILEHTALCGSQRFPVRDPFFMMTRRSLNTFMNAFTSNDWTAYPFASQNRKDFHNLLDVYLDAVFFSRLDELDFRQEGHRLEFSEPGNPASPLVFKGVVFNEMKGAMSSIGSVLWHTLCKHLFPGTTYHYNSGGDPEHITDLTYDELITFYRRHYHPGNAIFMTYGDIPATEHQQAFEEKVLCRFCNSGETITIPDEKRLLAPIRVEESYAFDSADPIEGQTHIVLCWMLGQNTSLEDTLTAQLVTHVLLENSASPLQHYLETTSLGSGPSPLCGLEDSYHELVFSCGIEGSEPEHANQMEEEILALLQRIADEGVPQERLEAILHQMELSQREITGDGYPYGLQLILTALPCIIHRGDPVQLLDLEPVLARLREEIRDPAYIRNRVRKLLLENQHRVRLIMKPDRELSGRRRMAENARLEAIRARLSETDRAAIASQAAALAERQNHTDDAGILPRVTLADVPETLSIPTGTEQASNGIPIHRYHQGTNGLAYQQLVLPVPQLDSELLPFFPLYQECLTEVGIGNHSFTEVQDWQSAVVGNIHALCAQRGSITNAQQVDSYFILSAKSLARNQRAMAELLQETLLNARFDEHDRIRDLISQKRNRSENSITGHGHTLAGSAACSRMSPLAQLSENWHGMSGIRDLKVLDDSLAAKEVLEKLGQTLARIHRQVMAMPLQILSVAEEAQQDAISTTLASLWQSQRQQQPGLLLPPLRETVRVGWIANSQVNFCARAYPTVASGHADAAALTVLGGFLRNGFLHTAIREKGGAYGSGASQDSNIAAFRFYSYRDPRIEGTLEDFDRSVLWLLEGNHDPLRLEEAILGVISSIDKPGSPAGEAKSAFHNNLFGRTPEQRREFRKRILQVTMNDLLRVAETYLKPEKASTAVVTGEAGRRELESIGLPIHTV